MKVPISSKKQRRVAIIVIIILWISTTALLLLDLLEDSPNSANKYELDWYTICLLVTMVIITIFDIFDAVSNIIIDEKGVTLRRGTIKVNYFSWEQVCRVETFEAMHRKSCIFTRSYITVLKISDPSWAFTYKRPPINLGENNISFAYDEQALALIKQYYKGDICS